jgi:hypothetical protein
VKNQKHFRLLGYDLPRTDCQPGETIPLTLYRADSPVEAGYSAFAHLIGMTYNPVTTGVLWGRMVVPIPPDAPSGDYALVVGFYAWQTGERALLAEERAGQDSVLIEHMRIDS